VNLRLSEVAESLAPGDNPVVAAGQQPNDVKAKDGGGSGRAGQVANTLAVDGGPH